MNKSSKTWQAADPLFLILPPAARLQVTVDLDEKLTAMIVD
jgi:hypothetical protein